MTRYEPAGELASRDLVSRAIVREQRRTGQPVYLSMAHLDPEWTRARFPTIADGVPLGRPRPRHGSHSGRPGRALRDGRRRDRSLGPHHFAGPVRGRRGRVHRRPRRQSPRQQFAARGPGVWRAGGAGHAAAWRELSTAFSDARTWTHRPVVRHQRARAPRWPGSAVKSDRSGFDVELRWAVARRARCCETAIEALDEWYAALGTDRSRIAALVTVGRLMARAALAPRGNPRQPRPRRLPGQR